MNDQWRAALLRFFKLRLFVCKLAYKNSICLFLFVVMCISTLQAVEEQGTEDIGHFSGPYCGLHCVYFVLRSSGQQINFASILKPEYIGSWEGSSLSELKKAIEDNGLMAEHYSRLTTHILREIHAPIILYVKKESDDKKYNHYVLFLGVKNNKAIIYDTPNQIKLVPFSVLAPLWSNVGLIVSNETIKSDMIFVSARNRFIIYAGIISGIILIIHLFYKKTYFFSSNLTWNKQMGLSVIQAGLLLLLSLFIGYAYHFCNEVGFLFQPNSTSGIQTAHQADFIPKVSKRKVRSMIGGNAIIIDARLAEDFDAGHLNGAINIPINSSDEQRHKIMADISKNKKIIVYCQSSICLYAEKIALCLKEDGFENIAVFKGGWMEWQKSES